MSASFPAAIPLVIGVTGHRDIDPTQADAVKREVRKFLEQLKRDYPRTPLVILTPLAAGADQLVAETARQAQLGIEIVAVLPWSPEAFALPVSACERGNCQPLISAARQVVVMPLAEGLTWERLAHEEGARQTQYEFTGRYIARHSQILLAIWDGVTHPECHTAKVVRFHRQGAPAPYSGRLDSLDAFEPAAVYHIPVRRRGATDARSKEPATLEIAPQWVFPQFPETKFVRKPPKDWQQRLGHSVRLALLTVHRLLHVVSGQQHSAAGLGEQSLRQRWKMLDRYNRDLAAALPQNQKLFENNRRYLIPDAIAIKLPANVQELRDAYAGADTIAGQWQTKTWWTIGGLFACALGAIACLETYAHLWHEWPVLLAYVLFLAGGYGWFRWTRHRENQGRWLDYRALAEALRVQTFWCWAGLPDCAADHYLRHFRGELDWIRHAVRATYLMSGGHAAARAPTSPSDWEGIERHWVADQRDYFLVKSPDNAELEVCFETGTRLAFLAAVGVTLYHLVVHATTHHMSHQLVLATFGALVLAAFLEEYADIHAFALLARRYRWMADLYSNAYQRLAAIGAIGQNDTDMANRMRQVLFDLGREALTENADWVVQHRQRPPTLPSG